MSCLTSELEQLIRGLCLDDFPCGHTTRETGACGEDRQSLVDLITCPRSPWRQQCAWSPEAEPLREAAARAPERRGRRGPAPPSAFRTLRLVGRGVSVIDSGLLNFSNLETLVLSSNQICDISGGHLPPSLKVLELHANSLCGLTGLVRQNLAELQHLGVGSNPLGSPGDARHLTGEFWPRLVSLDLSWCEFQDQRVLVRALATLACLRTLFLEGNPLTLAPSYPGFTIDSLQRLLYLDAQRITPHQRHAFKGLASEARGAVTLQQTVATVRIQGVRGLPETPPEPTAPEFPMVEYSYRVTYDFLQQQPPPARQRCSSPAPPTESDIHALVAEGDVATAIHSIQKPEGRREQRDRSSTSSSTVQPGRHDDTPVVTHSTAALVWDQNMDFLHTQTLVVQDLPALKRFLIRGLRLSLEEDKVLSWPAVPDEPKTLKDCRAAKGKESATSKAGSRDQAARSKDKKKKKCVQRAELLVPDPTVTRVLAQGHVALQGLLAGGPSVTLRCHLGCLATTSTPAPRPGDGATEKDSATAAEEEKKSKWSRDSAQRNPGSSRGRGQACRYTEGGGQTEVMESASAQHQPITVELSITLEKWCSASEADRHQVSQRGHAQV